MEGRGLGVGSTVGFHSAAANQMVQPALPLFPKGVAHPERFTCAQFPAFEAALLQATVHLIDFALRAQFVLDRGGNRRADEDTPQQDIRCLSPDDGAVSTFVSFLRAGIDRNPRRMQIVTGLCWNGHPQWFGRTGRGNQKSAKQ